jgi:hypothetical protein
LAILDDMPNFILLSFYFTLIRFGFAISVALRLPRHNDALPNEFVFHITDTTTY